ncbi:MAG: hypothetical protein JNK14_20925 [Chitinophagaceae bacterium]|nr:hypothetical protein [Chitinophagaceae bacterium]
MRRIAFFVEGLTERIFVEKFVSEILGQQHLAVELKKIQGGGRSPITVIQGNSQIPIPQTRFYILIYDCGGDSKIRSYIDDQRESLISSGYEKIIGVRDVFPESRADIFLLRQGLYYGTPQQPIPTVFILAIMEIESWFLSEHSHFLRIDPLLTPALISSNLAFDPINDDMEGRNNPAADLHSCYNLVGKAYTKKEANVKRTVDSLDFAFLYFNIRNTLPSFNSLANEIDSLF